VDDELLLEAGDDDRSKSEHHRQELWREAIVMALYLSIVVLATLAVLPEDYGVSRGDDDHGPPLLALIWGTTIGLALAHWFAFELTAMGFGRGRILRADLELAGAQLAGAAAVALTTTVVILISDEGDQVDAAGFVPALIIGVAGYLVARAAGRSKVVSVLVGVGVLLLGTAVAAIKAFLAGH
jgi:hypothetical protein